jgi:tetratricopeptide (TPR) repeat protein
MRKFSSVVVALLILVMSVPAMAQVRGKARLQGTVVDAATSKPIADAKVTIAPADGSTQPIVVKTNAKGKWSALGMTNGQWNLDIEATGYDVSRRSIGVSEFQMTPALTTQLNAVVVQAEVPASEIEEVGGVPQEIVDAVNLGQEYMAAEKFKEAVVEFEKALPALPDNLQLKQVAAQAYYKAGDLKKAVTMLEAVTAADTANTGVALLLTNLYLENGQLDEARARLASLPGDAITDPTVYVNIGILFLNKNNPQEALTYFAKGVDLDMTRPESFYYRGLAYLQLKKMKEAKADFQKVIELAPESTEGRDAKQLIDSIK